MGGALTGIIGLAALILLLWLLAKILRMISPKSKEEAVQWKAEEIARTQMHPSSGKKGWVKIILVLIVVAMIILAMLAGK